MSRNRFYNATTALLAGIRLLKAQVHNLNGTLELYHCAVIDLATMDANSNEVVTLLVNSDNEPDFSFGSVFDSSGISKYDYTPTSTTDPVSTWPALQSFTIVNTRLVTYIANMTYNSTCPYLLPEFGYVFETTFDIISLGL